MVRRLALRTAVLALTIAAAGPAGWAAQDAAGPLDRARAAFQAGHGTQALALLEAPAEAGDPAAQTLLGDVYLNGQGIAQDFSRAAHWYALAAGQGHAPARNALGRLYGEGLGVEADPARAGALLRAAAESGEAAYQYDYGLALEAGLAEAGPSDTPALWYERAAAQGHVPAQTSLGVLLLEGAGGERDTQRARALFSQAAEAGDARAQNNLGLIHARGEGVERDYETAARWFSAAAEQGLPQALTNLAVLRENGFGLALDEDEAARLYREGGQGGGSGLEMLITSIGMPYASRLAPLEPGPDALARDRAAALQGDPAGQFALAYRHGREGDAGIDLAESARWYRAAALSGLGEAARNLGLLYIRGQGVPQDYVQAYYWLNRAAAAGAPSAAELRDVLTAAMTPAQRARAAALSANPD